jgi:hypothetical protein
MDNYQTPSTGIGAFFTGTTITFILIIAVIEIIGMWKIFVKAGKPGWAAIVPIYNIIVLLEIIGKPLWWIILFIIPCVSIIFAIWTTNLLSKSFGQGVGFTLGLIFLGFIFYPLLGFGDYRYIGPGGVPLNTGFGAADYEKPFDINPE